PVLLRVGFNEQSPTCLRQGLGRSLFRKRAGACQETVMEARTQHGCGRQDLQGVRSQVGYSPRDEVHSTTRDVLTGGAHRIEAPPSPVRNERTALEQRPQDLEHTERSTITDRAHESQ